MQYLAMIQIDDELFHVGIEFNEERANYLADQAVKFFTKKLGEDKVYKARVLLLPGYRGYAPILNHFKK